ncbi:hypothetical protein J2792_002836 [Novosphingobium capsulatum]|uniref:Uncharacterized protein n=1 Tax=Novosphingobium capsulatum TaxID=13688 RepID=A0ABU1MNM9_9SPHN|nr:hypothetical protein [Novosphingobium capsulatum]
MQRLPLRFGPGNPVWGSNMRGPGDCTPACAETK